MLRDFKLSRHFSFYELTNTRSILLLEDNRIEAVPCIFNLTLLCRNLLDPIRDKFGPVLISSGFRSQRLNDASKGSQTSQHLQGEAADIWRPDWDIPKLEKICDWIDKEARLNFNQLIIEKKGESIWLHVADGAKREILYCMEGVYAKREEAAS